MASIARNVNNKKYVAWKYADFLDLKKVLSVMKVIDVAMSLIHSTISLSKLTMDMFFFYKNGNTLLYALTT